MKKLIYTLSAAILTLTLFASCEKEEVGKVQAEPLCGQWYVTLDGADAQGNVIENRADIFGLGRFILLTYNTAEDNATDIFVDDLGNGWGMKVQAKGDIDALTFSCSDADNAYYDGKDNTCMKVNITSGKIVKDGTTTPSGQKADYIEMIVSFDDDKYVGKYYDCLKISGWRYTGFTADN